MLLFAGLGNPGANHANNRHNVGFMAADAIARRHSFGPWSRKFQGQVAEGAVAGEKVLLLKPLTFMNLSGQSVGDALRFYKLDLTALTVFYDEIDLVPNKLRVRVGGGAGGHNGIRSIDQHCGNGFRRVRIGVGHPGVKELVHGHVLGEFGKADREWLDPMLDAIADNAEYLVRGDDAGFMNRVAVATSGGSGKSDAPPKAKGQSHIRQARPQQPAVKVPESGPMAAMLRKLLKRE